MDSSEDPLVEDFLAEWLDRRRSQVRPTTLDTYRRIVGNYLRPHLASVRLSELDRRGIERFYGQLLDAGARDGGPLSPRTVQNVHGVLRCVLKDAQLDGVLRHNPAQSVSPPRRHAGAIEIDDDLQVWTFEQAARFLECVEQHPLRGLWHLALGTGARRGELLGLRWKDVDLEDGTVTIRRSLSVVDGTARLLQTKNSRTRRLAIGPSVVDALIRQLDDQRAPQASADDGWENRWDLVFTEPSGRYVNPGTLSTRYRRLVRCFDVPPIRLHDLRHTHVSLLLQIGIPIKVISERVGHASVTTTMDTYAHLLPAMDQNAADTFAAILRGAGGLPEPR